MNRMREHSVIVFFLLSGRVVDKIVWLHIVPVRRMAARFFKSGEGVMATTSGAMTHDVGARERVPFIGKVKWFDPKMRYGFITSEQEGDLLVPIGVVKAFGLQYLSKDVGIAGFAVKTPKGGQCVEISSVKGSCAPPAETRLKRCQRASDVQGPVTMAVRSWNTQRGFGFFYREGQSDVFVHAAVVKKANLVELIPEEKFDVWFGRNLNDSKRRFVAIEIQRPL